MRNLSFDDIHSRDVYLTLKGLINNHNGEYKSAKQGRFLKDNWKPYEDDLTYNFAYRFAECEIAENEFAILSSAYFNFDPEKGQVHRGVRHFNFIFILDDFGVKELIKVTHGYEKKDGTVYFPPRHAETEWERESLEYEIDISKKDPEPANEAVSEHVSEVGKRIEREVELVFTTDFEGKWGTTYLFKFEDRDGNVFVWFTSSYPVLPNEGFFKLGMTIKDHDEYNGTKQTIIKNGRVHK